MVIRPLRGSRRACGTHEPTHASSTKVRRPGPRRPSSAARSTQMQWLSGRRQGRLRWCAQKGRPPSAARSKQLQLPMEAAFHGLSVRRSEGPFHATAHRRKHLDVADRLWVHCERIIVENRQGGEPLPRAIRPRDPSRGCRRRRRGSQGALLLPRSVCSRRGLVGRWFGSKASCIV